MPKVSFPILPAEVLDHIADAVLVLDSDGMLVYLNEPARQLVPIHCASFVNSCMPGEREELVKALETAQISSNVAHITIHHKMADDTSQLVRWSLRWQPQHASWYCTGHCVQDELLSEERLQRALSKIGVACFGYDVFSDNITYFSANINQLFGLPSGTRFDAAQFWSLMHPGDRERMRKEFDATHDNPAQTQHQFRVVHPDGKIVYLQHFRELHYDALGRHCRTESTLQDVSNAMLSLQALLKSEKRYRALVSGGSDLVGIVAPSGHYIYVGTSVTHLLGYFPGELVGRSAFEFIHPNDEPALLQQLQQVLDQKTLQFAPFRFRNKAGEWRWMDTHVTNLVDDPAVQGLVVNSRDITEEKMRNDKLQELSLIAEKSTQAILVTDDRHRITWVNKAFCTLSGYAPEDVSGKLPQEIFSSVQMTAEGHDSIQQQLDKGVSLHQEMYCVARDGRPYWIHLHIQPVYNEARLQMQYIAIGKDITERKFAEAELARSEQKFKALVQEGSDLIVIVDEGGHFTYCSDNVGKVMGYDNSELLHQPLLHFIHPDDVAETLAGIQRVITGQPLKGVRHRFRRKDGQYVWLESKGTNHYSNPLIGGMIVNARDINSQIALQQKLEAAEKNKQKAVTSAVIKAQESERSKLGLELHDNVNQVLTTVKLYNEMYLSGYCEDRSLLERSSKYLQECINEIRSISKRLSAPTLGKITLHDTVNDLVESINLTNKLQIRYFSEGLIDLNPSEDLHLGVYRIIQEGLNNIIKYAQANMAEIRLEYYDNLLHLMIADDGKGFDISAKRSGIGITNMKTRAENLNGVFSIHSKVGEGCLIEASFFV